MPDIDYRTAIYEPGADPLDYPSAIPASPLFVNGDTCEPIVAGPGFESYFTPDGTNVDELLARAGATPLSGRIASLAFGAHRNVANIAWKFAQFARTAPELSRSFLMVPAYLPDADVVACNVSSGGHMYSGLLATRPDLPFRTNLRGTLCPVVLLLLDRPQMNAMHTMAGIARPGQSPGAFRVDLADVEVRLDENHVTRAQAYSVALPYLALDGKPLAFAKVATLGRKGYRALDQAGMFEAVNTVLAAEAPPPGVIPIIDTINARRRELLAANRPAGSIADDPLFARVKQALASTHRLVDEDGQSRLGLDDVYPARGNDTLWSFEPLYAPRLRKGKA